ncbi:triose-phosphate isomerase [Candidatus Kaiserbacteria bacterium]|nr:triose-phosphate isomerase [Candidatus Kaiserbacteria bacterium]
MNKRKPPLVVGNWKQNPSSITGSANLIRDLIKGLGSKKRVTEVMVAPPAVFLSQVAKDIKKRPIGLVAQAVSSNSGGAHTGEISASMLKSVGVEGVIIGHSERRMSGVSDQTVNVILKVVIANKLTPIICVGETERDSSGDFYSTVEFQIVNALTDIASSKVSGIVIAYEPVWAIGSGVTATTEDILEMKLFIQKVLINLYGRNVANKVRILYGGSVKPKNATEIYQSGEVDGFLIGGASLKAKDFVSIISSVEAVFNES